MPSRKTLPKMLFLAAIGLILLFAAIGFVLTQPLFSTVHRTISATVDPARLERHVRMLSETLAPRDWKHPANLDRVTAYIKTEIESAGGAVSEQPYSMVGYPYRNVIGTFGPVAGERIVVGAHYDAFGPYPNR